MPAAMNSPFVRTSKYSWPIWARPVGWSGEMAMPSLPANRDDAVPVFEIVFVSEGPGARFEDRERFRKRGSAGR